VMYRVIPLVLCVLAFVSMTAMAQEALAPFALVSDPSGKTLYVAEYSANAVAVVDIASGQVTKSLAIPGAPGGLALSPDGAMLYVTESVPAGRLHAIDLASGAVVFSVPVGHTPSALAVTPDGKAAYVCNRFTNDVSAVDLAQKKEMIRIPVLREPVAVVLTPDSRQLFVANHLPVGSSDGDYVAASVSVIDTTLWAISAEIRLPNGCSSLRGITCSPDGAFVYVTHLLSRYQLPTTQLERGWMNTNALSIIDAAQRTFVNTVLLDDVDLGAANPWGAACSADGKQLCLAHAGSHEVSIIDRAALHEKLNKVAAGEGVSEVSKTPADVPNDLSFLVKIRQRISLKGNGPRGIILVGSTLFAAEYFSDSLGAIDLSATSRLQAKSIPLTTALVMSTVRKGEMLFNNAELCFQHWQSCASCHPDGRADGVNWDLMNDGIGNPKNTKSMLLSHQTPPAMSHGVRESAEKAVRSGIKFIQFAVRPEEDAAAIDEYLKSLTPVPSPKLVDGKPSPAAERGAQIFEQAGCAECHPAPLYTDLKQYDVGTAKGLDQEKPFDTPTLVEIWRTAPYLYDGRAATVKDVITTCNPDNKHGETSNLTAEQIDDLAEYVLSR